MLVRDRDGSATGGPMDVLCILENVHTGRLHVAFLEQEPATPGAGEPTVRLVLRAWHHEGAATLEYANRQLDMLSERVRVVPLNVCRKPVRWHGRSFAIKLRNWRLGPGDHTVQIPNLVAQPGQSNASQ